MLKLRPRPIAVHPHSRLSDSVFGDRSRNRPLPDTLTVGVLEGEGAGSDVIRAALHVLDALEQTGRKFHVQFGGLIGEEAEAVHGKPLSEEVIEFCRGVFADGGAILAGPGGGRFVYEMLLRESFCLAAEAELIERAAESVWQQGWRTIDLGNNGHRVVGTKEMAELVAEALVEISG